MIFIDKMARDILEKYYPVQALERELVKTIHRAGYEHRQIDSIIYSLRGSPGKGQLIIWSFENKVRTMRLFDYWGGILKTIKKYINYDITDKGNNK